MTKKTTKNLKTPTSVLAVFAHPDDMDFSSSGTIAKWADQGADITYLVCTDGGKGSDDPRMSSRRLAGIRRKEQIAAARTLGVKDVLFLAHPDGQLVADMRLKEEIVRVIRMKKPDAVITTDPAFLYSIERGSINHPDHRAAGQAAMDAVFPLARDRLHFPAHERGGLASHKVKTLLLVSFDAPNHLEDIRATMFKKTAALRAHKSQVGEGAFARVRERASLWGKRGAMGFAEGFKRIDLA